VLITDDDEVVWQAASYYIELSQVAFASEEETTGQTPTLCTDAIKVS
jgi:hypothetical protein